MAKKPQYVTPTGTVKYGHINKPDTKFNPDGVYKVDLRLEGTDAEKFQAEVDALVDEAWAFETAELKPAQIKKLTKAFPYEEETDDEGDPTGAVIFKFKQNAVINSAKGTKQVVIPIFDAHRKPIRALIYGGSSIKVAFTTRSYNMASAKSIGITMDMAAVQVIELVTGGVRDGAGYGFAAEEGYESSDEQAPPWNEDDAPQGDDDDGAEDF